MQEFLQFGFGVFCSVSWPMPLPMTKSASGSVSAAVCSASGKAFAVFARAAPVG